ncbi:endonuclease/exonuclease/phosphatase family domain-containing protein 1-like [Actinia tenebrosa]|uniref:Endonuclease/exonuclease/phosphatase family domain-containing protein 1-like n=1 Tax=Actinia tenebrosa TaxID=6105 RepID=A0A6P8HT07_ACTTE|nr:endonuclease/exonuclease/phosphatase family domain-containing protein 1-like [Actinia tenebrosa]
MKFFICCRISVAVFQEIGDEKALHLIQDELNRPTLKKIEQLKRPKSYWECVTSDVAGPMYRSKEFNGFLFDSSRNIELKSHDLLEKPLQGKKQFARRPFIGFFKAKRFDFVVVSVHLKATGLDNEDLSRLQVRHYPWFTRTLFGLPVVSPTGNP